MMKIAVVYDSVTGNTKQAAEWIAEGMRRVKGIEAKAFPIQEVDVSFLSETKGVVIGCPSYMASMTPNMRSWLMKADKMRLAGKLGGAFSTEQYTHGGGELVIQSILANELVFGMLCYSGGNSLGKPVIHLGPVAVNGNQEAHNALENYRDTFRIYGERFAQKAKEIYSYENLPFTESDCPDEEVKDSTDQTGHKSGHDAVTPAEDLRLHIPDLEDGWFYMEMMSDPATMSYNARRYPPDGCIPDPESEWMYLQAKWIGQEPERFYAYLQRVSDGKYVGHVNYHYNPRQKRYDMGIVICSSERNKGYGKQGIRMLLERAFTVDGLPCLHIDSENTRNAAYHIHTEAGFRETGIEDGMIQLELTNEEYSEICIHGGSV